MSASSNDQGLTGATLRSILGKPAVWYVIIVVSAFALTVLLGISNSSLGVGLLTDTGAPSDDVVLGVPRPIRSDEYLRTTPWRLGTMISPPEVFDTPLAADPSIGTVTPTAGVFETLVFVDAAVVQWLAPVLPDAQLFAAYWWLPVLVVLIGLPMWLGQLGVRRSIAIPTTLVIVLGPVVAWWSLWPLLPLAWASSAAVLLVWSGARNARSSSRLDPVAFGAALCSGVLMSRTALAYYPWALPLGLSVLVPSVALILASRRRARHLVMAGIVGVVAIGVLTGVLIENIDGFRAATQTVYPGGRVVTGAATNPGVLFGAQHLGILRDDPAMVDWNASEVSTAYTILLLPTMVVLAALPIGTWRRRRSWVGVVPLAAIVVVFMVWTATDVPATIGNALPLLNRVPAKRLMAVVGIPITLLFAVVLDHAARQATRFAARRTALLAGAAVLLVSAWAGSLLRGSVLPQLTPMRIWVASALAAAVVATAVAFPRRVWSLGPMVAGAMIVGFLVNPLMVGMGGLRSGAAATVIDSQRDEVASGRWTSDTLAMSAILMANGAPAVSGQQWVGPDADNWLILDPGGLAEDEWNRGAAYIVVIPVPGLPRPLIAAPRLDVIEVQVDPCDPSLDELEVVRMVSIRSVASDCLVELERFSLSGEQHHVYRRSLDLGATSADAGA